MADLDYFPTPGNLETTGVGGSIGGQTFHWQSTVISQYANSAVMMTLCDTLFQSLDQINNLNRFYDDVWNIRSARGYGLDVWGRIVVASRTLPGLGDFFGFDLSWRVVNRQFRIDRRRLPRGDPGQGVGQR